MQHPGHQNQNQNFIGLIRCAKNISGDAPDFFLKESLEEASKNTYNQPQDHSPETVEEKAEN